MENRRNNRLGARREILFDRRYEGPPNITQGGYLSGSMAVYLESDTVAVTMRRPTPMGKPLTLDTSTKDRVFLYDGDTLLNEARPADLNLDVPQLISLEDAKRASLRHVTEMPYADCFGCGSGRSEDDGLHLRSGPIQGRSVVATDWVPRAQTVGAGQGEQVPEPIVWAGMECPIAKSMEFEGMREPHEMVLLGRMTTKVIALPKVGESYFFMGWPIERAGRKLELGGTLNNKQGEILVMSRFTFIALREGMTYDSVVGG